MTYESVLSPSYGPCYSLYTASQELGRSSLTGAGYGLSLVLDIQQGDYLQGGQTVGAGARVAVQHREDFPLLEEFGVDIPPGRLTSLALQVVNIRCGRNFSVLFRLTRTTEDDL